MIDLTLEQRTAAIDNAWNLVVKAAADVGKSRALVPRIAQAIHDHGIAQGRFLAFTFLGLRSGYVRAKGFTHSVLPNASPRSTAEKQSSLVGKMAPPQEIAPKRTIA